MFQRLEVHGWRQFEDIQLDFHPHLTILTGANGAGKTTLLGILSRHVGWSIPLISTPRRLSGILRFISDWWEQSGSNRAIGRIVYRSGATATLRVPADVAESYNLEIEGAEQVRGLFIPSHRPVYVYQKVQNIPTELNARQQLLDNYLNELRTRYAIGSRSTSPSFRIKESLISLATFGYGNEAIVRNDEAIATYEGFQRVLRVVLPKSLGFQRITINPPEVILETATGPFSFDAVSGGMAALIDITWQFYMCSLVAANESFVVIIDEPENHLHPELQRSLLPNLVRAFPGTQIIAATHNPFMVTSSPDARVFALTYVDGRIGPERRVVSSALDLENRATSANDILRDVLGVPSAMPVWVEERIAGIVERYSGRTLDESALRQLRQEMATIGMAHVFPETVAKVMQRRV